jgi:hypothetical protein
MFIYGHKLIRIMPTNTIVATVCIFASMHAVAQERIDLESTFVGDREQPSVSYITPWKPPEGPSKLYRPIESISDNALEPVDREVLARSNQFYNELSLEGTAGGD